ncbi:unnamed protein product [Symbiodinium sp. KB8]|nr:unnamed protein product [Symbiodinium sp. KB8]
MSLDGRSTYNTVSRTAVVRKLDTVATALIPFVRSWFGQQSTYIRWDASRQRRTIHQGEEWTPWHRSCTHLANTTSVSSFVIFVTADEKLRPGECLAPFLADVYLVATWSPCRHARLLQEPALLPNLQCAILNRCSTLALLVPRKVRFTAAACLRTNEAAGRMLGGAYGKAALLGARYTQRFAPRTV